MAKIVHLVMSDSFAGIEQHVDELLTYSKNNEVLICTESIAKYFNEVINVVPIKDFGRNSIIGKYKLKKKLKRINPDVVHTHGSKTTSIINSIKNIEKDLEMGAAGDRLRKGIKIVLSGWQQTNFPVSYKELQNMGAGKLDTSSLLKRLDEKDKN